jgi:2-C-methyl-D-erythritol 2,4-cyclodiphosphate synthase
LILKMLRIGLGVDSHRIEAGGPMKIGGVDIPCELQLVGHSDADVLLHAITDAVLGAAGLEDIGQLFPDTASENRNRDSGEMLTLAWRAVQDAGFDLVNLDCVLRLERPKISPHKNAIRQRIAVLLSVNENQVSLKGKTGESIGEIGQGRLAEAHCVALLSTKAK